MRQLNNPTMRRLREDRGMLLARPRTVKELAEAVQVSERTVKRELKLAEREWGWKRRLLRPSYQWKAENDLPLAVLSLNKDEALALLLAEPALRAYGSSPFGGHLRSALQRIVDSLETPADLEPLPVDFQLLSVREVDPGLFQQITYALRNQQRLWIRYHSPDKGETLDREIDPHLVFNHDGGWYVAAYCHVRLRMRTFAISAQRILELRFTEERFERQPDFDVEAHRRSGFGAFKGGPAEEIRLLFAPSQQIYQQERVPRPGEVRELQPDGRLLITFPAPLSPGLRRWVLQYGKEVEVLAPAALREEVRQEVEEMVGRYGGTDA